jgi:cytoskeletal protein RodZ
VEAELPAAYEDASDDKPVTITKKTTSFLYILLALMLVFGLLYVVFWFATSPADEPADNSSQTESTLSDIESSLAGDESYVSEAPSADEESSLPEESPEPEESSQAEESSEPEESSQPEESVDTTPAELPRTTTRLRMRKAMDTSDNNNIITTIPENTHVEILRTETDEAGDLWYFVRYTVSPGMWHEGYCFAEYIETETEE